MKKIKFLPVICGLSFLLLPFSKAIVTSNIQKDISSFALENNDNSSNNINPGFENVLNSWNNDRIRTKFSSSSRILERYQRTPAQTYTSEELKENWNEIENVDISKWPQYDNQIKDEEYVKWYLDLIDKYGSGKPVLPNHKLPTETDSNNIPHQYWPMMSAEYLNWANENNQLKKHPAADYQYGIHNKITDDIYAVKKEFNLDLNQIGSITTGLFLPPGEQLTVKIEGVTEQDLNKMNLSIHLGQNELWNVLPKTNSEGGKYFISNWYKRMPSMFSQKKVDKLEFKFGSPFGGIVNFENNKYVSSFPNFKITLSGAVESLHYIHGKTTENDWSDQVRRLTSKNIKPEEKIISPIADIATDHIKFIGPTERINVFKKDNNGNYLNDPTNIKWYPQKVMDWWDIMALDGYYTINDESSNLRAVKMLSTNYVPAGLAVSIVRIFTVYQPLDWMNNILDLELCLSTLNTWGSLHEFNHQNYRHSDTWGFSKNLEVVNNTINIASYFKYSNVFSNRDDSLASDDRLSKLGHASKITSYGQIFNNYKAAQNAINNNILRHDIDTDYAIIASMFGPETYQKIIRSYTKEDIRDFFGNKIKNPIIWDKQNNRPEIMIYRTSLITGFDWSDYYYDMAIINEQQKNEIKSELLKISNTFKTKIMMPVGSWYASKINYGNFSNNFYRSSTPFLLTKDQVNGGALFSAQRMIKVPEINNKPLYKISNFRIIDLPKNGEFQYWEDVNNWQVGSGLYTVNPNSEEKYDTLSYAFDVTDKNGNTNTVNFQIELQLEEFANFSLSSNTVYNIITESNYVDLEKIISSRINVNVEESIKKTKLANQKFKYYASSTIENWFNGKSPNLEAETTDKTLNSFNIHLKLNSKVSINNLRLKLLINTSPKEVSQIEVYHLNNKNEFIKSYNNDPKLGINAFSDTIYNCYFPERIESDEFIVRLTKDEKLTNNSKDLRFHILDFSMNYVEYIEKSHYILPKSNGVITSGWTIDNTKGQFNKESLKSTTANSKIEISNLQNNSLAIYGYKNINGGEFIVKQGNKEIATVSTKATFRSNWLNNDIEILGIFNIDKNDKNPVQIVTKTSDPVQISHFISLDTTSNVPTYPNVTPPTIPNPVPPAVNPDPEPTPPITPENPDTTPPIEPNPPVKPPAVDPEPTPPTSPEQKPDDKPDETPEEKPENVPEDENIEDESSQGTTNNNEVDKKVIYISVFSIIGAVLLVITGLAILLKRKKAK